MTVPAFIFLAVVTIGVVLTAILAVMYYREPADEAAQLERDLDAAELEPLPDLPGPVSDGPAARTLPMSADASTSRAGELHLIQPHYPELDPLLDPLWLDQQLADGRWRTARQVYIQGLWRAQMLAEIIEWAA
jgi:hypothetical protein